MRERALRVRGLRVSYPGRGDVLRGVSLELAKGEAALVVGERGSGKTTLARALAGVAEKVYGARVEGYIEVGGSWVGDLDEGELRRRLRVVPQNPWSSFVYPIVYDDLVSYAAEALGSVEAAEKAVGNAAKLLKISHLLERHVSTLSGGEARRAAIAKAMLTGPCAVVMDEPLMWLDDEGVEELRRAVGVLKAAGVGVLLLEHRYERLADLADSAYELKGGTLEAARLQRRRAPAGGRGPARPAAASGDPAAELRGVVAGYDRPVLNGVDLVVGRGEKVAIFGRNGSGKTTLLRVLAGVVKPQRGRVVVRERPLYLPQAPYLYFTEGTLGEEAGLVGAGAADELAGLLGPGALSRPPATLSWGEATEAAVLIALRSDRGLLLLDEPFSGLSYPERERLGRALASSDKAVVATVSSSDNLEFLGGFTIYELAGGRLVKRGAPQ